MSRATAANVDTPQALARELAGRARELRALARELRLHERLPAPAPAQGEPFADTYAQTVVYGLWSARWLSRGDRRPFSRARLPELLPATSPLLRELLARFVAPDLDDRLARLLDEIAALLARTPVDRIFAGRRDPAIHFYQDFLDVYDPQIRRERGVYYTPDEVVELVVRTAHAILQSRMDLRLGLADPRTGPAGHVVTLLDPATGTGTFLLHALRLIFATMREEYARLGLDDERAAAAWQSYVREDLLPRLHGFERMMAPYVVAHLRLGLALERDLAEEAGLAVDRWGFRFAAGDRLRVFLTHTLARDPDLSTDESREADRLKRTGDYFVVLGNPPYDRVAADADPSLKNFLRGPFDEILAVARERTVFSHHASLYNLYVYFWRWALSKVFEDRRGPGVVGFVTASSWLTGPGFVGLRKLAREHADEIWTVDLGGDNKGANAEANVFDIEIPVAITTLARTGAHTTPATAHHRKLDADDRTTKLAALARLARAPLAGDWTLAPAALHDPLVPAAAGRWLDMPALADLFPWQQPGCKYGRLWPIAPAPDILEQRWRTFVSADPDERPGLFYTARVGRNIHTRVAGLPRLVDLDAQAPHRPIVRYAYRSFDRQWAFDDPRMARTESPSLWASLSARQLFLIAPMTKETSRGPCLVASECVPDLDHFRGSFGGKDVLPLYRDAAATRPNITHGLQDTLAHLLQISTPSPESLAAYIYALLSAPRYQQRFADALRTPGPRVPLTRDHDLWRQAVALGERLLWLHTYAERYRDPGAQRGATLPGIPGLAWRRPVTKKLPDRPTELDYDPADQSLKIGDGEVAGVRPDVWQFEISGMPVVRKWLGYRTAGGAGKAAASRNRLDRIRHETWPSAWSDELLDLLRVLTATLDLHPQQAELLDRICDSPQITRDELPAPTAAERRMPRPTRPA